MNVDCKQTSEIYFITFVVNWYHYYYLIDAKREKDSTGLCQSNRERWKTLLGLLITMFHTQTPNKQLHLYFMIYRNAQCTLNNKHKYSKWLLLLLRFFSPFNRLWFNYIALNGTHCVMWDEEKNSMKKTKQIWIERWWEQITKNGEEYFIENSSHKKIEFLFEQNAFNRNRDETII